MTNTTDSAPAHVVEFRTHLRGLAQGELRIAARSFDESLIRVRELPTSEVAFAQMRRRFWTLEIARRFFEGSLAEAVSMATAYRHLTEAVITDDVLLRAKAAVSWLFNHEDVIKEAVLERKLIDSEVERIVVDFIWAPS